MTVLFHDVKLPDEIEQGSQGGPEYLTSMIAMSSGFEQRNIDWQVARQAWDISYGIDSQSTFDVVRQFFYARRGKAYGFRFRDWTDYQLNLELIGTGDGVKTDFQITKTMEATGPLPYVRNITRPNMATLSVTVGGTPTTLFSDLGLGKIRFNSAPAAAAPIVVVYVEFDIPMRFDIDKFPLIVNQPTAAAVGSMPIVELRE